MILLCMFSVDMWRGRLFLPRTHSWPCVQNRLSDVKKNFTSIASILQQVKTSTRPYESDFKEGEEVEGFVVQQVSDIPEFQLRAIRLQHEDTGAQYLHLERDDTNNAFSINLRTTPFNSSGVPHILEHTTLCGSKKYPCKDPFFKMLNRSLATFMNAMTGPDFTLYPFATQNKKDFYNLMSVYMDAVFNPQLKETDFRQEGWRLEHEIVDDPTSPIIFKGVVFNEMKGALSDNQRIFSESVMNKMLPSHTYSVISGGDPLHIPQLSYEQLKQFHSQFYHPSNARFYSYGNFPLREHLRFINDSYLKQYGKVKQNYSELTKVPNETRWKTMKKEHIFGKVDSMAADPKKQSTIAISYLCSDIRDIDESFVLQVLSELLVSGPNSAFYKSLVEPNIGSGFTPSTGYETQTRDTLFSVGLQGVSEKDFDWVVDTCNETIDKVIKEGFNKDQIEAIIHSIELIAKHQSPDFGLRFLYSLSCLWNHEGDIINALHVNDVIAKFKEKLAKNPNYLQEKVEQYFKQNSHKLVLTMSPDTQYDEKKLKQESDLLQSKLSSLTPEMKDTIYKDGLILRDEQDKESNVECLPTLTKNDLKKDIDNEVLNHINFSGVPVQVSVQPTNGITYMKGILDVSHLHESITRYIPLFVSVATKMGTKNYDFRQIDQMAQLKTGGLSFSVHLGENKDDTTSYENGIMFTSYSLDSNIKDMFSLWEEIFNNVRFQDKARLETLMKASASDLINNIADKGHVYAMSASAALVNNVSSKSEEYSGLNYIMWLCNLIKANKYEDTLSKLDLIAKTTLHKKNMRLAVNFSADSGKTTESNIESFINSLQGSFKETFINVKDSMVNIEKNNIGLQFESPLPVNYASKSVPSVPYKHKDYAALKILCRLLSSKYLLPTIREKGGAYGAGVRLTPSGVISFFSYRDPKPADTFETFDGSLDWINKNNFTDQDIEESKLGIFQTVDAPIPPGARGSRTFLYGITDEEFRNHRLSLMDVSKDDIVRVASEYLNPSRDVKQGRTLLGPYNVNVKNRLGEYWHVIKI